MKIKLYCSILLLLSITTICFSQNNLNEFPILFYNVENLFDLNDDSQTNDEEFTPEGVRHWTYNKLHEKLLNLSKVVLASSGWTPPGIVALGEIENRYVLEQLIHNTPLESVAYRIIHKESPDHRGMDVALLYNENQFFPLEYKYYSLKTENDSLVKTREILYVSGVLNNSDTLHLFVNHWPSRYSGLLETKSIRKNAALLLREKVDVVEAKHYNPKIIILGDFNDQPQDESIQKYLGAKEISAEINSKQLYNLSFNWMKNGIGTLKYQSQWSVFDQIIVSGNLLKTNNRGFFIKPENAFIIKLPFLFEKDKKYGGIKPKRSYVGFRYNSGFSDHLPVLLKLQKND